MSMNEIIKEMKEVNQISITTAKSYNTQLLLYEQFQKASMQDMIEEAEREEEQGIKKRKRKIKQRLLEYRNYLMENGYENSTINKKIQIIKTIYNFYELDIPRLSNVQEIKEAYNFVPTADEVKQMVIATPSIKTQAIIMFLYSSGCGRKEASELTIGDFKHAVSEYTKKTDIQEIITVLESLDQVIPTFHIRRVKTNNPYITFCTTECVKKICLYLKQELRHRELNDDEALFNIVPQSITAIFGRLNEKLNYGKIGNHNRIHPHTLRTHFATTLKKSKVDTINIHFMMGHRIDDVSAAYFKADPEELKEEYIKVYSELSLFEKPTVVEINSDDRKELEALREETSILKKQLEEISRLIKTRD